MRLLVVEDEPKLARFVQERLTEESFAVDLASSGEEGLERARATTYDLIILDIMLPQVDGFTVCRELRAAGLDVPILMLSARGLVDDRVRGLNTGADDYLTKPFDVSELTARVRTLLRRQKSSALRPLTVADLTLDPISRLVTRGERRINLTPKEYDLLEYLMRHAGQVVTRSMIAEHVWGLDWKRLTNIIDVYVNHLRRKIEGPHEPRLIHAMRRLGYVIREGKAAD
jgi:DNA-binding response OmpR family regulator